MGTLLTDTITTTPLTQKFKLKSNDINLHTLGLHLIKMGTPSSGNLVLTIKQDSNTVWTLSTALSTLNAVTTKDYAHGTFRFDASNLRLEGNNTEYTLEVSVSVYDSSNFYELCRDWTKSFTTLYGDNQTSGVASLDQYKAYHIEMITDRR